MVNAKRIKRKTTTIATLFFEKVYLTFQIQKGINKRNRSAKKI